MKLTYVLPLRRPAAMRPDDDLARYVRDLACLVEAVVVVDGSAEEIRRRHIVAFGGDVTVVAPAPEDRCANGKAWGVLSGLRHVVTDGIVIADDDVRWSRDGLVRVADMLERCELVIPQNYFTPMTWHAAWDTGRTLLNRALGHDWPGTLALTASALPGTPAYSGDVLFENCELVRTVRAWRGRVRIANDLLVARRPPTVAHFVGQRPRQAYDDLAQPVRLAVMLSLLPLALWSGPRASATAAAACVALAEVGRRRGGGAGVFPWYASFAAPLWVGERAALSWWAVWRAVTRRGVAYAGVRILRPATPQRELNRGVAATRRREHEARPTAPRAASGRI